MYASLTVDDLTMLYPTNSMRLGFNIWIVLFSAISLLFSYVFEKKRGAYYPNEAHFVLMTRLNYVMCIAILVYLFVSASYFTTIFFEDCSNMNIEQSIYREIDIDKFCKGLNSCDAVVKSVITPDDVMLIHYTGGVYLLAITLILTLICNFVAYRLDSNERFIYPAVDTEADNIELRVEELDGSVTLLDQLRAAAQAAIQNGTSRVAGDRPI
jgi:hypothetical protein